MPIIVVGGSGRNVGKTSLICGIVAALPEYSWIAVKVTSHDHGSPQPLWEEDRSDLARDTARFRAAGARRTFLLTGNESEWPALVAQLRSQIEDNAALLVESNRIVNLFRPDVYLAVRRSDEGGIKPSFQAFAHLTHATVMQDSRDGLIPGSQPVFRLSDLTRLSLELQQWLREKLSRT